MGCRGSITSEAFRIFDQVDIFTLRREVKETEVGITIVTSW
jgi:hypothetical protein